MNVAIVCDFITHHVAGASRSTLRFAELLSKRGHKIVIIAAKHPETVTTTFHGVSSNGGIKVYKFRSVPLPRLEGNFRISLPSVRELRGLLLKEKIQVLHVMVPTPAAILAAIAAKPLGIKIVAHSHTQPQNVLYYVPGLALSKTLNNLFNRYLVWLYKKADIVICPAKLGEKLLKNYDPSLKVAVVSNGVDISKFKKVNPRPFLDKYGLSKRAKRILFVGRLHPEKSIDTLIKSMPYVLKKIGNAQLYIVGSGYLLNSLKKLSAKLGVRGHVKFFGRIPDKELVMAYNACDIFVLPSVAELEGMVVLEAMACGKPLVIANSENSASADLVDGNGFLFNPGNYKDLAEKILALLQNGRMRRKMAYASYRKSKHYDVNKSVKLLEKIYHSV